MSVENLSRLVSEDMEAVNAHILEACKNHVELIPAISAHLIAAGGKRLRPMLTLASAKLCGHEGSRHINLAAAVEFMHTATLLHDDVVDESTLRRGMSTANALWSNKASVLVGDFLFSRAFELMVKDGSLDILQILSSATSTIAEGEVMQLASSHDLGLSQETYLKIIDAKTARLFSAATEVGAVVGGADDAMRRALGCFGHTLGIAFQLMDDVLDYTADQEKLGKAVGDDFREGKVTLPVILAYKKGAGTAFWKKAFEEGIRNDETLSQATGLLKESGALLKTKQIAQDFVDQALECLKIFPNSSLKEALQELAYFSLHREV